MAPVQSKPMQTTDVKDVLVSRSTRFQCLGCHKPLDFYDVSGHLSLCSLLNSVQDTTVAAAAPAPAPQPVRHDTFIQTASGQWIHHPTGLQVHKPHVLSNKREYLNQSIEEMRIIGPGQDRDASHKNGVVFVTVKTVGVYQYVYPPPSAKPLGIKVANTMDLIDEEGRMRSVEPVAEPEEEEQEEGRTQRAELINLEGKVLELSLCNGPKTIESISIKRLGHVNVFLSHKKKEQSEDAPTNKKMPSDDEDNVAYVGLLSPPNKKPAVVSQRIFDSDKKKEQSEDALTNKKKMPSDDDGNVGLSTPPNKKPAVDSQRIVGRET